ncbi:hypothetical protein Q4534_20190 [Cyclobacterium sp. 1_MG-2023]|uniref:hypothetical protein n=1 Tax=Cyclobacterium sp. 1_MG-2023 TaxID=3062681 RepID=UPI0026E29CBB|nr:hypothetical protein [Cyclobacterium sp. 1_MG-2023]MDO6439758.1 hypothetical protein [Cyclobacterium sp. 1_MG-2023]
MAVSRNDKEQIVKAYIEKSITREEMDYLLKNGCAITQTEWVYNNEGEKNKQEQKRRLLRRVFGHSISGIEWCSS